MNKSDESKKTKIGAASWSYVGSTGNDFDATFKSLVKSGIEGIELSGSKNHHHPDNYPTKKNRNDFVNKLESLGLSICCYYARTDEIPPTTKDESEKHLYLDHIQRSIDFCIDCQIPTIRVDTAMRPPYRESDFEDAKARTVELWKMSAEKAADAGLSIAWEFEPGFVFNKPHDIIDIVHRIDAPNFGVMFDTSHSNMCASVGAKQTEPFDRLDGGVPEMARLLSGKIMRVHLCDSDGTLHDNISSTHLPLGAGTLDFDAIMTALIESHYKDQWWSIDTCFQDNPLQAMPCDVQFVKGLLRRFGLRD